MVLDVKMNLLRKDCPALGGHYIDPQLAQHNLVLSPETKLELPSSLQSSTTYRYCRET
jgi:hypothetical protein